MTDEQELVDIYHKLLARSEEIDGCFERIEGDAFARARRTLLEERKEDYWTLRNNFEELLSDWLILVRKTLEKIPFDFKKYNMESSTNPYTGEMGYYKKYENDTFSSTMAYFNKIIHSLEGHDGIFYKIEREQPLFETMRDIRGTVLLYTKTLPLFVPEIMFSIDQYVKLIFQLAELGLAEIASLIESINNIQDRKTKCLNARTALEKYIDNYLENEGIEMSPSAGFYIKLKTAIRHGLEERVMYDSIARHYTYISKIVHGSMEANERNSEYAINGILNILLKILPIADS